MDDSDLINLKYSDMVDHLNGSPYWSDLPEDCQKEVLEELGLDIGRALVGETAKQLIPKKTRLRPKKKKDLKEEPKDESI